MPPVGMHQSFGDFIDRTRKFRVHQQWQARPRNMGQSGFELLLGDHREAVDTWMNKKALEPQHSRRCERRDVVLIVVDNAAPGCPVYSASFSCRRTLESAGSNHSWGVKSLQTSD